MFCSKFKDKFKATYKEFPDFYVLPTVHPGTTLGK